MITQLSDALTERGYTVLTDVQTAVTAPELDASDLLVSAQTGSGKTVGFGLAIAPTLFGDAESLPPPAAPLALVIAPTRELALQVQQELSWLYKRTNARVASCIGGMDARNERRALERGAHIVVGTPGRLRDHIERGALDLASIRAIVLDEADEMLDLGFREDLEFMLGAAPADRRTLMFSATVPPSIAELAKSFQRDAVRVTTLVQGRQHADIDYQAVQVAASDTEHAIINLLRYHDAPSAVVFANTRATVARLTARFANRGFAVVSLSGELSQDERSHALQALRDGRARVCVATDVAARGIDLPNLELVIHADLPTNTEGLLHRSGRTGRAGRKGTSLLIVPDKSVNKAMRLLKWAKIEAKWGVAPSADEIRARDEDRLLADPAWEAQPDEGEAAFAARLLERFGPEQIATACLRLYRARLSAPEELNAPAAAGERRDPRETFGPSGWVSLSVGRDRNAEPRWLLPMLCRAGNLEKSQIGKIRVTETETLVELAEPAIAGFLAGLGAGGELEDGIRVTQAQGAPEKTPRGKPPARFDHPKRGSAAKSGASGPDAPKRVFKRDSSPEPGEPDARPPARDAAPTARPKTWSAKGEGGNPASDPSRSLRSAPKSPAKAADRPSPRTAPKFAGRAKPPFGTSAGASDSRSEGPSGGASARKKPARRHDGNDKGAAPKSATGGNRKPAGAPAGQKRQAFKAKGGKQPPRRKG